MKPAGHLNLRSSGPLYNVRIERHILQRLRMQTETEAAIVPTWFFVPHMTSDELWIVTPEPGWFEAVFGDGVQVH